MDPTGLIPAEPAPFVDVDAQDLADGSGSLSLSSLLKSQMKLVGRLQQRLERGGLDTLEPREVREYLSSITTILTLAHRTEDLVEELKTYQQFRDVVIDWARSRSSEDGEDLVEALRQHAEQYRRNAA